MNYGKQSVDEKDIQEVISVLKSNYLTTGPNVLKFEGEVADFVGSKYAVVVSSGTAALHLACLAVDLKEGDELITSPITFVASANCALYCGAKPIFSDVNKNGLIRPEEIKKKVSSKTKVLIPVHYSGLSCDLENISKVAKENNLILIEDSCHALGAKYKNSKIGDCKYSDMCIFSFHPVKHITTGEGGMITTNSKELYNKLIMLRSHGIVKNDEKYVNDSHGPWYYEMQELGFNYRITDFQCALGSSQLKKIDKFISKRREIAKKYNEAFEKNSNIKILKESENTFNPYHLYVIKVKDSETRLNLFNYLSAREIFCQVHYIPVYLQPYYQKLGYAQDICPVAEEFYSKIISIPMYPDLTEEEQKKVIKSIGEFFGR